jgi:hypothetical protein
MLNSVDPLHYFEDLDHIRMMPSFAPGWADPAPIVSLHSSLASVQTPSSASGYRFTESGSLDPGLLRNSDPDADQALFVSPDPNSDRNF